MALPFSKTVSCQRAKGTNMSTQWTMTWLVRWRVRDWASCFSSSRLPSDDREVASSPHVAVRNKAFDKNKDNSFNRIYHNNLSQTSKKWNKNKQLKNPMVKDKKDGVPVGNRFDDSSWSISKDEDYIVFCFREDGASDVMKDGKGIKFESETVIRSLNREHTNPRPVNRKLTYDEDAEQVSGMNIHEQRSNANKYHTDQHDQHCITPSKEDEKIEMVYSCGQQHRDIIRRACLIEGIGDRGMIESGESRDSDQSEGSRGSFAFPVLGWEWIGSPVQMPKSEGLNLKKQKMRSVRFHCCRF